MEACQDRDLPFLTEADVHRGSSVPWEFFAEDLPGDGCRGLLTVGLKATVEFGSLGLSDLQQFFGISHAVPEVLGELNSLGDSQAPKVGT